MTFTYAPITSTAFLAALTEIGIFNAEDKIRRVVIDAAHGEAVQVHVERYGDERLLNVVQTLEGIEITRDERS